MFCRNFLFKQFLLTLIIILFANISVKYLSRNVAPRKLIEHCQNSAQATDVFLGNSLIVAGFRERVFDQQLSNRHALNAGLGAVPPVDHFLIYHSLINNSKGTVYYGFYDTQLTDEPTGDWSTIVSNRNIEYYLNADLALSFYPKNSFLQNTLLKISSYIPILTERYSVWSKVEKIRRRLSEIGLPHKGVNEFGRKEDFELLEAQDAVKFALDLKNKVELNKPIISMIKLAKERDSKIYFIEMPMPSKHREKFYSSSEWKDYRKFLIAQLTSAEVGYINASDWIDDSKFTDNLHLNETGAVEFTTKIAHLTQDK